MQRQNILRKLNKKALPVIGVIHFVYIHVHKNPEDLLIIMQKIYAQKQFPLKSSCLQRQQNLRKLIKKSVTCSRCDIYLYIYINPDLLDQTGIVNVSQ